MFLLSQHWPILAIVLGVLLLLVVILMWLGRLSLSQLAVFVSAELILAVVAQHALTEAGLIGLLAGEYNEESVESFNQVCLLGCRSPAGEPNVCPQYCGCVVSEARQSLSYEDMLARTAGLSSDSVVQTWNLVDRTCRQTLRLR